VTLVLSDVPGDRPSLVGSGPTIRARQGDITRVVGSNRIGLAGAAFEAKRLGFRPRVERRRLGGEARVAGRRLAERFLRASPGEVVLAGGETTVSLGRSVGRGGRNLEVALGAAIALDGEPGIALLAAGSDGKDGTSSAAGALVDGRTIGRARRLGADPAGALSRHDTEPFLVRVGGLFRTGPTGTNVGDWAFGLRVLKSGNGKRETGNEKRRQ
jgi:glycerate-2-kinase